MHVGCFAAVYGNLSGLKKEQTGVSTFHCFVNTCAFATTFSIVGFAMCPSKVRAESLMRPVEKLLLVTLPIIPMVILLMAEIPHQLIGSLSHNFQGLNIAGG